MRHCAVLSNITWVFIMDVAMTDSFWAYMFSHWPAFACGALAVVGAIILTWWSSRMYHHWTYKIKTNAEECKKIGTQLMPELKRITASLLQLNGSFNNLVFHLGASNEKFDTALFVSKSPLRLTDIGLKILEEIGGKDFIDKNETELIAEMNKIGIKTALDSQTNAPVIIGMASNKESFNHIKDYIFNHPNYNVKAEGEDNITIPLNMNVIQNVMGIYLRDKYLAKHPELNPDDIPSVTPPKLRS